jgi:hypothetical protein
MRFHESGARPYRSAYRSSQTSGSPTRDMSHSTPTAHHMNISMANGKSKRAQTTMTSHAASVTMGIQEPDYTYEGC